MSKTQKTEGSPKYATCIINYNTGDVIEKSMSSFLPQISSEDFEIIVVDNKSTDASLEILAEHKRRGSIQRLLVERSSRGKARQLAMTNSRAPYLIANLYMDVVYLPKIREALEAYHARYEGEILSVYGAMIMPRVAAMKVGGWRDLDRRTRTTTSRLARLGWASMHKTCR